MEPISPITVLTSGVRPRAPEWSLYGDGHVIAGAIVRDHVKIEAQILFDGTLLYRSRHFSQAAAEQELVALRGHWASEGWVEAR